jgi:hypothetical protein
LQLGLERQATQRVVIRVARHLDSKR